MRQPHQVRLETSYHEGGHAAACFLFGIRMERAEVLSEGEIAALYAPDHDDVDFLGRVWIADESPANLEGAVNHIVMVLSGTAAATSAIALGVVTDEQVGARPLTIDEISLEELVAVPGTGQGGLDATVGHALYRMSSDGDLAVAEAVAEAFTSSPPETSALLSFCRARTTSLMANPTFQRLVATTAELLLERGSIEGDLLTHLLDREATVAQFQGENA